MIWWFRVLLIYYMTVPIVNGAVGWLSANLPDAEEDVWWFFLDEFWSSPQLITALVSFVFSFIGKDNKEVEESKQDDRQDLQIASLDARVQNLEAHQLAEKQGVKIESPLVDMTVDKSTNIDTVNQDNKEGGSGSIINKG